MRFLYVVYALFVFLFVLPNSSYAGTNQINKQACCCSIPVKKINLQHHWYVDLGLGWIFNAKEHNVYVNQLDAEPDLYLPNGKNNNIILTLSGGYNWFFPHDWLPTASVGIEYSYIPQINNNGQIEQFSDPALVNYNYGYKTLHNSLSLLGKLDIYRWNQFMPFILAGIGNSWNDIKSYQETALPGVTPRISPGFSNGSRSAWKYTLGIGLDYQPSLNLLIGLSYRYDTFNKGQSGTGIDTFANERLNDKSTTNTLMLNARYLFA